mgnify:CR=1 FL=1
MVLASIIVKRSTTWAAALSKFPAWSSHVLPFWFVTSTTSVLPSHRPRELPSASATDASTCGCVPMGITRNVWLREWVMTNVPADWTIPMSPGV